MNLKYRISSKASPPSNALKQAHPLKDTHPSQFLRRKKQEPLKVTHPSRGSKKANPWACFRGNTVLLANHQFFVIPERFFRTYDLRMRTSFLWKFGAEKSQSFKTNRLLE
jgi:hypothetical protein